MDRRTVYSGEERGQRRNRRVSHRKIQEKDNDGKAEIYGIFAPSPTVCLVNGIDIELKRLKLTDEQMDPAEYDEKARDKMELSLGELKKLGALSERAIKMTSIMENEGIYLLADAFGPTRSASSMQVAMRVRSHHRLRSLRSKSAIMRKK